MCLTWKHELQCKLITKEKLNVLHNLFMDDIN